MHYGRKESQQRQGDVLGIVLLGNQIKWEISCYLCGCYLICTTYMSSVALHVHPFMETVFPDASFSRIMHSATKQK